MKRKVQAQRKFAQGAFIPPFNNNNIDRRIPPEKEDQRSATTCNVHHHAMSASSLLDVVAFDRLHRHDKMQPVVRLERLKKIHEASPQSSQQTNGIRSPKLRSHGLRSPKGLPIKKGVVKPKKVKYKTKMNKPVKLTEKTDKGLYLNKNIVRSRRLLTKRRITNQATDLDTDIDDDTPLKYFAKGLKTTNDILRKREGRKKNKTNTKPTRLLRKSTASSLKKSPVRSPVKSPVKNVSPPSSSKPRVTPAENSPPTTSTKQPIASKSSSKSPIASVTLPTAPTSKSTIVPRMKSPTIMKSPVVTLHNVASASTLKPVMTSPKKFIKRILRKRAATTDIMETDSMEVNPSPIMCLPSRLESESTLVLVCDDSLQDNSSVKHGLVSERQVGYYGVNEIEQWITDSILSNPNSSVDDAGDATFKVPEIPEKKQPPATVTENIIDFVDLSETDNGETEPSSRPPSRAPSTCPSERYVTVRDVVSASKNDLDTRCKNCSSCARVNKVQQLSKLMQKPTRGRARSPSRDIYEFDAERDDAVENTRLYDFRQSRRATRHQERSASGNSATARDDLAFTSDDDAKYLYLDLLPEKSKHVIQIMPFKVPNQNKQIMRARLMPKSSAKPGDEFSLVEHENLLDQLLETLNMSLVPAKKTGTSKENEQTTTLNTPEVNVDGLLTPEPSTSRAAVRTKSDVPVDAEVAGTSSQNASNNSSGFPKNLETAKLVDAPVFYPSEAEFNDPVAYFEKIMPVACKYGLCKVVAPSSFQPKCTVNDQIRFNVSNQYIARLYSRWGQASKEMCAIKAYLASQSVPFTRAPVLEGIEIDLPKLYRTVQNHGGLKKVIEKKRWSRIAEEMRITKGPKPEKRLDTIYVKHLLPYDTLSNQEREQITMAVTKGWHRKNQKILDRALNPLHRQKQLLGESDSSDEEPEEDANIAGALTEAEDCVVSGKRMPLTAFRNAAEVIKQTYYHGSGNPQPREVELEYWRYVLHGTDHVCVYTASIDTGEEGYGFTKNKNDPYGKHPWNLKMISQNSGNVLRSLGPVLGVTVPTLHVGMMFSTSCWHRDPHGLPWIEYMHSGPAKIWYGIPDEQSDKFRNAVETLCPTSCQNKSIWLPSDITMIPPNFLLAHKVSLSRVEQKPGEFIIVFPKAYSCSISTGYTQSESVYFATNTWLNSVDQVFQELRDSCEPTMFSLEQLLISVARDNSTPVNVLQQVHSALTSIVSAELQSRRELVRLGVPTTTVDSRQRGSKRPAGAWNVREQDECEICRATLYLSKVTGLTGKKTSVCLQHALRLLNGTNSRIPSRDVTTLNLILFYSKEELSEVIACLQSRFSNVRDTASTSH